MESLCKNNIDALLVLVKYNKDIVEDPQRELENEEKNVIAKLVGDWCLLNKIKLEKRDYFTIINKIKEVFKNENPVSIMKNNLQQSIQFRYVCL